MKKLTFITICLLNICNGAFVTAEIIQNDEIFTKEILNLHNKIFLRTDLKPVPPRKYPIYPIGTMSSPNARSGQLQIVGNCYNDAYLINVHPRLNDECPTFHDKPTDPGEDHNVNIDPIPLYQICYDVDSLIPYYAASLVIGSLPVPPSPKTSVFTIQKLFWYKFDKAYANRKYYITKLLGETSYNKYFSDKANVYKYFSKGHLNPTSHQWSKVGKNATMQYINTAPQWQLINGGNWQLMENKVMEIASSKNLNLFVWTGTYGQLTLPNDKGEDTPIKFHTQKDEDEVGKLPEEIEDRRLPVPKYFWKAIQEPSSNFGVVFVQLNNPYEMPSNGDPICEDVCDQVTWLNWPSAKRYKIELGFTYCCTFEAFKKVVPYGPQVSEAVSHLHSL